MNSKIQGIIQEWCYEGHSYLYDEQPADMKLLEAYLDSQTTLTVGSIYRRTDRAPVMEAQEGDVIRLDRVTSWSGNPDICDAMYEEVESCMLVLVDELVRGVHVTDISFYKDEEEMMLSPCTLKVTKKSGDVLECSYI